MSDAVVWQKIILKGGPADGVEMDVQSGTNGIRVPVVDPAGGFGAVDYRRTVETEDGFIIFRPDDARPELSARYVHLTLPAPRANGYTGFDLLVLDRSGRPLPVAEGFLLDLAAQGYRGLELVPQACILRQPESRP